MLIRFAGLAAMACIAACDTGPADAGGQADTVQFLTMDAIDVQGAKGIYTAKRENRETRIEFAIPADRVDPLKLHSTEQVGETPDGIVAVLDRYASRAAGARCADGRESWVRVFSLTDRRQIAAEPVESCLDGLVAADPPVSWIEGGGIRIGGASPRSFRIENGALRPQTGGAN